KPLVWVLILVLTSQQEHSRRFINPCAVSIAIRLVLNICTLIVLMKWNGYASALNRVLQISSRRMQKNVIFWIDWLWQMVLKNILALDLSAKKDFHWKVGTA